MSPHHQLIPPLTCINTFHPKSHHNKKLEIKHFLYYNRNMRVLGTALLNGGKAYDCQLVFLFIAIN